MSTQFGGFDINANKGVQQDNESEGAWLHLRDVEGEPLMYTGLEGKQYPVRIRVAGTYSKQYRAVTERHRTKLLKGRRGSLTAEGLVENLRETAAACVLAWEGLFDGGQVFACTKENAIALFAVAPWFQEQVEEQMQDHASFFKKPSTS